MTISKVPVLNTCNELLDTDTWLVLASRQVTWYSGKVASPGYPFGNSNTRYIFSIQQSIHRLIHPYGPDWIDVLGISNNIFDQVYFSIHDVRTLPWIFLSKQLPRILLLCCIIISWKFFPIQLAIKLSISVTIVAWEYVIFDVSDVKYCKFAKSW